MATGWAVGLLGGWQRFHSAEVYELITTGLRYFSFWQLMLDIGVLLHMSVIGLRYYHHSISNFTKTFATDARPKRGPHQPTPHQ